MRPDFQTPAPEPTNHNTDPTLDPPSGVSLPARSLRSRLTALSKSRLKTRALIATLLALAALAVTATAYALVDPWPKYQPQTTCSPSPKPGTLKLAAWLQKTYPGSGSYGISRACSSGGRSEHKEGRAFDWRVNVNNARERGYAESFIRRLRADDSKGNADALARRMGVMYVIWNDHIYSSTYHYAARPYLNASCRSVSSCSKTLRHRDHVHISLTWAGARAQTSWYTGKPSTFAPEPNTGGGSNSDPNTGQNIQPADPDTHVDPSRMRVANFDRHPLLRMSAAPGRTTMSPLALARGRTYKVTVYGVTRFGPGHQLISDAACVWDPASSTWRPRPSGAVKAQFGDPQLKLNGRAVLARASCRGGRHVYSARITPRRQGPLLVSMAGRVQYSRTADTAGLNVVVSRPATPVRKALPPAPQLAAAPVPDAPLPGAYQVVRDEVRPSFPGGISWSDEVLQAGVTYKVTVSGVRRIADGVYTDGQCLAMDGRWEPRGSLDPYFPGAYHGSLYLDGTRFAGAAPAEDPTGCQAHTHTMLYTAPVTGRLPMRIWDPTGTYGDSGNLNVRIDRVDPVALPTPAPAETPKSTSDWTRSYERFDVAANSAAGRISASRYKVGQTVHVYVTGGSRVTSDRWADASCVTDGRSWVPDPGLASGQDLFGLTIDGAQVDWAPTDVDDEDCSPDHEYYAKVTITKNGPLRVAVADLDYADNSGSLRVLLMRG